MVVSGRSPTSPHMHLAWLEAIAYSDDVTESGELLARTRREQEKNHGGRAMVEIAALRGRQRDFDALRPSGEAVARGSAAHFWWASVKCQSKAGCAASHSVPKAA